MIVYNAGRAFFTMKADADAHRKTLGLPPSALVKLDVRDRDDLAWLLNLITNPAETSAAPAATVGQMQDRKSVERILAEAYLAEPVPDFVPKFLADEHRAYWQRKLKQLEND